MQLVEVYGEVCGRKFNGRGSMQDLWIGVEEGGKRGLVLILGEIEVSERAWVRLSVKV